MKTIGMLTAGGDCPGLNAAIRGTVMRADGDEAHVIGVVNGWQGLMEGNTRPLGRDDVRDILGRGGTILGTSRLDPYVHGSGYEAVKETIVSTGIEVLIVVGGDGSLRTAVRLEAEGLPVVGVPKTIDNDIPGTDVTFGFDTAVQVVSDAIDRLTTTAESHNRIIVVEVMGRTAGWIATYGGMAGGAEAILVPEVEYDLEQVAARLLARHQEGRSYSIVVVAEGVPSPGGEEVALGVDAFGFTRLGGVSVTIASELERLTGYEARVSILGHLQRGGTPTAYDRILGSRMGIKAAEFAIEGRSGVMVALQGTEIVAVDLEEACAEPRPLPRSRYEEAGWLLD